MFIPLMYTYLDAISTIQLLSSYNDLWNGDFKLRYLYFAVRLKSSERQC